MPGGLTGSGSARILGASAAAADPPSAIVDGFGDTVNYIANVTSDVNSVPAAQSLSANKSWGFSLVNDDGSNSQTGAQVAVDTASTGLDLTNTGEFGFDYQYGQSNPNAEGGTIPCPAPSASSETCPSPGATIPPSGSINVFTAGPGLPATASMGFDSSRTTGDVADGKEPVTVYVTLNDPRYESAPNNNWIRIMTFNDDVDESSTPTVTANGAALPPCSQSPGTACVGPVAWNSYQFALPGGQNVTCDTFSMNIGNAQDTSAGGGTPTQYAFSFDENDPGAGGCPTGVPGVAVMAMAFGSQIGNIPCSDDGTVCATTFAISGLGNVTDSVASGQGVTAFDYTQNTIYSIKYSSENAPSPPAGAVSTTVGSSTSPTGTATACNPAALCDQGTGVTATAPGQGVLTVSQFGADPVTSPPIGAAGAYFDVEIAKGSAFSTVTIEDCDLNGGDSLDWWNGSSWVPVLMQTGDPSTGATITPGPPRCATAQLSATSSPAISQLTGTRFAVVHRPVLTVLTKTMTIKNGKRASLRLACARARCKGRISITKGKGKPVVLGAAAYSIAAGKRATETIALNKAGKKALGRASQAKRLRATLKVTVAGGASVTSSESVI